MDKIFLSVLEEFPQLLPLFELIVNLILIFLQDFGYQI